MLVALVALAVLIATATFSSQLFAQSPPGTISGLTLTSNNPGELVVSWDIPSETPSDYRISWAPSDEPHASWKAANTSTKGNSYPAGTSTSLTLTGLPEGEIYKVRMRARYNAGQYAEQPLERPVGQAPPGLCRVRPLRTRHLLPEPTSPLTTRLRSQLKNLLRSQLLQPVTLSATTPVVGKSLTATLVDPDALGERRELVLVVFDHDHRHVHGYHRGDLRHLHTDGPATWEVISGLTASYTDSSESDQSVSVDSTDATIANPSPIFADALVDVQRGGETPRRMMRLARLQRRIQTMTRSRTRLAVRTPWSSTRTSP